MSILTMVSLNHSGVKEMLRAFQKLRVLHEHMKRLGESLTPTHPSLRIPQDLHAECPWPSAQADIAILNAYKAPRDKLACAVRCADTIENLVRLARGGRAPAADDVIPVLVFVLVKANPVALLSNVQYVDAFCANRLRGAAEYRWVQLKSAVEFVKRMLALA